MVNVEVTDPPPSQQPKSRVGAQGAATPATSGGDPHSATVIKLILQAMGVDQVEPAAVAGLLEFMHRYVSDVLEEAQSYSVFAGNNEVSIDDLRLAIQNHVQHSFTHPPSRSDLMEQARVRNAMPLPTPNNKSHGLRLPPERYCLMGNRVDLVGAPSPVSQRQSPEGSPTVVKSPKRRGRRRKAAAEPLDEDD